MKEDLRQNIYNLNTIILSMRAKQKLLDGLKSEIFKLEIYGGYIDNLIDILLNLMGFERREARSEYYKLIEMFLDGDIENPDEVVDMLDYCNWDD